MARPRSAGFTCRACGGRSPKWAGQCPECGEWNTLEENVPAPVPGPARGPWLPGGGASEVRSADEVAATPVTGRPTGIGELDRVLGGGLVPGAVVLLGGDPGIGKSTLLLQLLCRLGGAGTRPLYVSGEESLEQICLRARRLGLDAGGLRLLAETRVERVLELAAAERPGALVIDSIQTLHTGALGSAPGSVAQVRESAAALVRFAKGTGAVLFLVGHVTKDGAIAGPRVLEHMVDTVLYFEAEADRRLRIIRAVKNRFGAANELGLFAMTERGLREVANPSAIFLSRHGDPVPGSVVTVTREGSRPLLVELQALADESHLATPRRVALGVDPNRLAMLLAVLHRHAGVAVHGCDVFVNVVGGVRVGETAADLAVLAAVLSSLRDRPLDRRLAVFGEVGLAGEIRPVTNGEERLAEAAKHGFERAVVPRANRPRRRLEGLEVQPVERLGEALERI